MVKLEYFYKGLDNHNKLNKTALGAVNYYCPFKIVDDGFTPFLLFALTLDKGEQLTFRKMNTNKTSLGGVQLVNVVDIDISVLNDITWVLAYEMVNTCKVNTICIDPICTEYFLRNSDLLTLHRQIDGLTIEAPMPAFLNTFDDDDDDSKILWRLNNSNFKFNREPLSHDLHKRYALFSPNCALDKHHYYVDTVEQFYPIIS